MSEFELLNSHSSKIMDYQWECRARLIKPILETGSKIIDYSCHLTKGKMRYTKDPKNPKLAIADLSSFREALFGATYEATTEEIELAKSNDFYARMVTFLALCLAQMHHDDLVKRLIATLPEEGRKEAMEVFL